jgi:hypothetical protein
VTPGLQRSAKASHCRLAEFSGSANTLKLLSAFLVDQLVHEARFEAERRIRKRFAQGVVLVDRQIIMEAWIDLQQADLAAVQLQLLDTFDHHFGETPAARLAHIFDGACLTSCLDVGAAHRIDQGRLALKREDDVVGDCVPLPVTREPEHAAAEAPVIRSARNDDAVQIALTHLGAQRFITSLIFGVRKFFIDGVAIVRRIHHVVEEAPIIEALLDLGKWVGWHWSIPRYRRVRVRDACSSRARATITNHGISPNSRESSSGHRLFSRPRRLA